MNPEALTLKPTLQLAPASMHFLYSSLFPMLCSEEAEVAEVEMLLEAYDMHLEQALSRLQTLDE